MTPRSAQGVCLWMTTVGGSGFRHRTCVSRSPRQPAELITDEPFLGWWAVDEGLLTPDQLRSSAWRRLFRGVYVHRDVPVTHALRAHAASVLLPAAVVTGRSAAVLWGVDLAGVEDDVEVTIPSSVAPFPATGCPGPSS